MASQIGFGIDAVLRRQQQAMAPGPGVVAPGRSTPAGNAADLSQNNILAAQINGAGVQVLDGMGRPISTPTGAPLPEAAARGNIPTTTINGMPAWGSAPGNTGGPITPGHGGPVGQQVATQPSNPYAGMAPGLAQQLQGILGPGTQFTGIQLPNGQSLDPSALTRRLSQNQQQQGDRGQQDGQGRDRGSPGAGTSGGVRNAPPAFLGPPVQAPGSQGGAPAPGSPGTPAVPAAPGIPQTFEQMLAQAQGLNQYGFDPAYAQLLTSLGRQNATMNSQTQDQSSQLQSQETSAQRQLEQQHQQALKQVQDMMASRGLFSSGITVGQEGDTSQQYAQQSQNMHSDVAQRLADLTRSITEGRQGLQDQLEQAQIQRAQQVMQEQLQAAYAQAQQQAQQQELQQLQAQQPQPTPTGQYTKPGQSTWLPGFLTGSGPLPTQSWGF